MLYYSAQQVPPSDRGFVGDWCPVCQQVRVQRVGWLQPRLLPLRRVANPEPSIYAIRCQDCRTLRRAEWRYRDTRPSRPACALDAAAATTPEIAERLAEQERHLTALLDAARSPDERIGHLERAIRVVDLMAERRVPDGIDHHPWHGIVLRTDVGFVLVPLVLLATFTWHAWTTSIAPTGVRLWMTVVTIALTILLAWRIARGGRGWARRRLLPRIARAVRPVDPTLLEVEIAVRQARVNGSQAARLIDHRQLHRAIWRLENARHSG